MVCNLKQALQVKGIVLGILLLLMAIASSVAVFQLRADRNDNSRPTEHTEHTEQP